MNRFHYIRTDMRMTRNAEAMPVGEAVITASVRADRNYGSPGTNFPVLIGETTIVAYWQPAHDGAEPYLVIDVDTSSNGVTHGGGDNAPINLKVTVNDGTVYPTTEES